MDPTIKEQYLEKIPIQIRDLVKCLDNDNTLAVYGALLENDRMGFNELKDLFDANPSQIDRSLKDLISGGLIIRRARNMQDTDDNNRIYYELSDLGQGFYDCLFDLVIPSMTMAPAGISVNRRNVSSSSSWHVIASGLVNPSKPPHPLAPAAFVASVTTFIGSNASVEIPFEKYKRALGLYQFGGMIK